MKLPSPLKKVSSIFSSISKSSSNQDKTDKRMVFDLSKKRIPSLAQFKYLSKFLSKKEKITLQICVLLIVAGLAYLGTWAFQNMTTFYPAKGGVYTEGIVGSPKYINPLYASANEVDLDMTKLVFAGLVKYNAERQIEPDLAETWQVSDDQKEFTLILNDGLKWSDGKDLTVDDVIFTISSIQNNLYASPLMANFSGVTFERINDLSIKFILKEPYAPFLENLTIGIIPEHLWQEVRPENTLLADYNLKPIGSGPYKFKSLVKDKLGNIKSYSLVVNDNYHGDKPFIEEVDFKFYPNFESGVEALKNRNIDGLNFLPLELKSILLTRSDLNYHHLQLPQYTGVFFNEDDNLFKKNIKLKEALAYAINKNYVVDNILGGEGSVIDAPILEGYPGYNPEIEKRNFDLEKAKTLLDEAGYKLPAVATSTEGSAGEETDQTEEHSLKTIFRKKSNEELTITLTTVNNPDNFKVAEAIQKMWREVNIKVELQIVDAANIQTEIIRPRKFQALLFGEILGADPDLYAFWHSSQAGELGLNLSNYKSREADSILKEARAISDPAERAKKYINFQNILNRDLPAIFLYTPTYTYVLANKIKGFDLTRIVVPSDRFNTIGSWYIKIKRGLK